MTDDRERLARQMMEIGNRYLRRTLGELDKLKQLVAAANDAATLKEIEHLAHKIHGSGAMFGFDAVSARAGEMETLAAKGVIDAGVVPQLEKHLVELVGEVQVAARERGIV